ncbi:MAG: Imm1 family immunity protein [Candidatus Contendobacter sp.]|nr:Imm1 family immunity protein [Candidatus Contendobacter sp.]MDS4059039.1 Imm1 family immunity protein [Candidatus Contendobacter sp.]
MKVKKIFEEEWIGAQLKTIEHQCTDLSQAYAALDRLDGKKRTSVEFWVSDDAILTVGGGGGKFVVFAAFQIDEELYTLIDPNKSDADYEDVVTGGQLGSYPSNQCVDKDMVKKAISYFCEHGKASPNLAWIQE